MKNVTIFSLIAMIGLMFTFTGCSQDEVKPTKPSVEQSQPTKIMPPSACTTNACKNFMDSQWIGTWTKVAQWDYTFGVNDWVPCTPTNITIKWGSPFTRTNPKISGDIFPTNTPVYAFSGGLNSPISLAVAGSIQDTLIKQGATADGDTIFMLILKQPATDSYYAKWYRN